MKILSRDIYHTIRFLLICLSSCILFLVSSVHTCHAQDIKNEIQLSFIKKNDSLATSGLHFNVLRIINNSSKFVGGEVSFIGPENWKILTFPQTQAAVNPGDTVWIPLRVSPPVDAIGGISYIITASLRTKEKLISENAYVTLPPRVKWDFSTNKSSIYFTEFSPNANFQVKLANKGNTNELIKVQLKIGKLLVLTNGTDNEYVEFISLPAFKDTLLTYDVTYKKKLSYEEKTRLESSWKESTIITTASTASTEKSAAVMIRKLNNTHFNRRAQNSSPLNIDYQIYNLMSNQKARYNVKAYGSILFPKNRDLQYSLGLQNIYYGRGSNENFDINHQFLYSLKYSDKKNKILLGYNINGGDLHPINGRGISGSYEISNSSRISYALSQNPFSQSLGEFIGYSSSIKKISVNAGIINENTSSGNYAATSLLMGAGFTAFKHHGFSFQVLGSSARYNLFPGRDTSVLGLSYRTTYSVKYSKFDVRLSMMSSARNYIRSSGRQHINLNSNYRVTDKVSLILYGFRQSYSNSGYPNGFFNPANVNSNDYLRLTASISHGKISYNVGPSYIGSTRQFYNPYTNFKTGYKTFQPGIYGSASFRLNGNRSLTPNITVSNLRFSYTNEDTVYQDFSLKNNLYYSAGLNYYDNAWKVNAYYSSGSTTDLYRSIQVDEEPVLSRSIQLRPSYEKFLFNRTVRLSAYLNYAFYMPSGRENVSYNLKYDHYLKQGWAIYISGYVYSNTRVDDELGRINTKDINFIAGVSKSFDIQQPRLKYYDFKAVFFNDLDGNLAKSENEPPVPNILVNIEKNRSASMVQSNMAQMDLLSDVNGEIYYENLPKDDYTLSFTPLVNLQSLYFLNGSEQGYYNDQDRVLYIPLAESYKIKGRIIMVRDPNSSEGKISLDGIRVSANGLKGETYSALTDNFGAYILNVPKADKYMVRVNNVFGQHFVIETDEMEVQFTGNKTISLDFVFMEKRRELKFNEGNEFFQFKSIGEDSKQ